MNQQSPDLTETQADALREIFNMCVGRAAASLCDLIGDGHEIELSIPHVDFTTVENLTEKIASVSGNDVCAVNEEFIGPFSGNAMLIYSQKESLELIRLMLDADISPEEVSEMESEALCEVGNIILNACLSTIANLFDKEFETEIPTVQSGDCGEILSCGGKLDREQHILYLNMQFHLAEQNLDGHIGFSLSFDSSRSLLKHVDEYVAGVLG